jgi:hypothetical protein
MHTFIIATTAAAALFASGAFAQEPSKDTAAIPDFSGVWSHPYLPGYEPPASGRADQFTETDASNMIRDIRSLLAGDLS